MSYTQVCSIVVLSAALLAGCLETPLPDDSGALGRDMRDEFAKAISDGDLEHVVELLNTEPLLASATNPSTSQTPLHVAAITGNVDIIVILLENGADPYVLNDEGDSPYDFARRKGASDEVLKILSQ